MYITISPQKLGDKFSISARDFITYLEKENRHKSPGEKAFFFNQFEDQVTDREVVEAIDANTAKLKKTEAHYYSITVNPSRRELQHIQKHPQALQEYTRALMREYAASFHREIDGRPVELKDILFFAKIEHRRYFSSRDREIKENTPSLKRLAKLRHDLVKIRKGELSADKKIIEKEIHQLLEKMPHKFQNRPIEEGMAKPGLQTHVHIIVSRKDSSNRFSLSPGSKYRTSEIEMHGKLIKRGFERDRFFQKAEQTFDRMFHYQRNFVEEYQSRKALQRNPAHFYRQLMTLPLGQRKEALGLLQKAGVLVPAAKYTPAQVKMALKQLQKAIRVGLNASSIGY